MQKSREPSAELRPTPGRGLDVLDGGGDDCSDDWSDDEILDEVLIEDVSIDGMCGVY